MGIWVKLLVWGNFPCLGLDFWFPEFCVCFVLLGWVEIGVFGIFGFARFRVWWFWYFMVQFVVVFV